MQLAYLTIAILLAVVVILACLLVMLYVSTARERQNLYNRLQCGTIADYATYKPILEKPVKKPAPMMEEAEPEYTFTETPMTTGAAESLHKLMSYDRETPQ
jgi:hypothetical protein